jgi:hypothetical protein
MHARQPCGACGDPGAHRQPAETYVLFLRPAGFADGWEKSDLWQSAADFQGVTLVRDDEGREARRFGAATSGQTLLYDAGGALVFSGGITGARGQMGANAGQMALINLLGPRRCRSPGHQRLRMSPFRDRGHDAGPGLEPPGAIGDPPLQTSCSRSTSRRFTSGPTGCSPADGLPVDRGIIFALYVSPVTWEGPVSRTHIHVWAAILLGGAICLFPAMLGIFRAGVTSTRYTIAVAQMLMGALLIHLTGGRIETHFPRFRIAGVSRVLSRLARADSRHRCGGAGPSAAGNVLAAIGVRSAGGQPVALAGARSVGGV